MHGFQPGIWILCPNFFYFTLEKLNFYTLQGPALFNYAKLKEIAKIPLFYSQRSNQFWVPPLKSPYPELPYLPYLDINPKQLKYYSEKWKLNL